MTEREFHGAEATPRRSSMTNLGTAVRAAQLVCASSLAAINSAKNLLIGDDPERASIATELTAHTDNIELSICMLGSTIADAGADIGIVLQGTARPFSTPTELHRYAEAQTRATERDRDARLSPAARAEMVLQRAGGDETLERQQEQAAAQQ